MFEYSRLKKEFDFLVRQYGFRICSKQSSGAWYYIKWTNPNANVNIKVLYDFQIENPISIYVYEADWLGAVFEADEYKDEFATDAKKSREKIHCAAIWLKEAIENKVIVI